MKIELLIRESNLGDNTSRENDLYALAVKKAIKAEYPQAAVYVEISDEDAVHIYDDELNDLEIQKIADEVDEIANDVWNDSSY